MVCKNHTVDQYQLLLKSELSEWRKWDEIVTLDFLVKAANMGGGDSVKALLQFFQVNACLYRLHVHRRREDSLAVEDTRSYSARGLTVVQGRRILHGKSRITESLWLSLLWEWEKRIMQIVTLAFQEHWMGFHGSKKDTSSCTGFTWRLLLCPIVHPNNIHLQCLVYPGPTSGSEVSLGLKEKQLIVAVYTSASVVNNKFVFSLHLADRVYCPTPSYALLECELIEHLVFVILNKYCIYIYTCTVCIIQKFTPLTFT